MEEIAESLNAVAERSAMHEDLLRIHINDEEAALELKLDAALFHPFKDFCKENFERFDGYMKEISEIADGEQEGAFVKVCKCQLRLSCRFVCVCIRAYIYTCVCYLFVYCSDQRTCGVRPRITGSSDRNMNLA